MAEKKKTEVKENLEREYVIPLREKSRPVPRYKKTPKAVKTVKEFLVRHMKIRDRDLKKIKIDPFLNEILWFRGIKKHPHKIKVKVIKKGDIVEVSAVELPKYLEFKKKRLDKRETNAQEIAEKKKTLMQKAKEQMQGQPKVEKTGKTEEKTEKIEEKDKDQDGVDDKVEEKEKQKSVGEAGEKQAKAQAKQMKQTTGGKVKQKTAPIRKALSR